MTWETKKNWKIFEVLSELWSILWRNIKEKHNKIKSIICYTYKTKKICILKGTDEWEENKDKSLSKENIEIKYPLNEDELIYKKIIIAFTINGIIIKKKLIQH